ncbi:MAG: DEAD/DEAH box helicase [Prevotellaceae bacterium]|nr:DEAD/DEAH box helicase [Prevotellaceae bacterium]
MKTFEELGVREEIRRAIEELGFAQPMPVQEKTIPFLLERENSDLIALAQTGTGKTAAFGIPLIQSIDTSSRATQAVVVAPTRELCLQIADDMKDFAKFTKGLHISAVYGGTSIENQRHELKHGAQIIVATPGRLIDLKNRGYAKLENVRKIVLDEADEMLNMGFSESINEIFESIPEQHTTLLFSATMSREVERVAKQYLRDYEEIVVGSRNEGSENVNHIYYLVNAKDKYLALKRVVDFYPRIYAIVFCRTKAETQEVADHLIHDGYNAESLHGDLSQQQRDLTMQKFRNHLTQILVATDVAARGLDVDDLTHVINYAMPDDIASYTHRSGRTGRAGKKGTSIAIIHTREKHKIRAVEKQIGKEFVDGTLPTPQEICTKQLFRAIDEIEKVDVIEEQIEPFMAEVRRHFEYVDKEDILKKMVSREFGRFLEYYANAPEIEKPVSRKERTSDSSRSSRGSREPKEPRTVQKGYTRLFINLGKDHGFYPGEVMQFVNRHVQGRQEVGHIDLMSGFSFIEVPERDAKKVMAALDGTFYKGRQVRCNEDRSDGKPSAGGRGRGRKGDSEGRGRRDDEGRGRSSRGRKDDSRKDGDFSRFEKKSKRNNPRKDFDSDVAGMPETGDWRQFFKKNDDQSRRRGNKNTAEPDFSEEGWARRKPRKK